MAIQKNRTKYENIESGSIFSLLDTYLTFFCDLCCFSLGTAQFCCLSTPQHWYERQSERIWIILCVLVVYDFYVSSQRDRFLALVWVANVFHVLKFIYLIVFQFYEKCNESEFLIQILEKKRAVKVNEKKSKDKKFNFIVEMNKFDAWFKVIFFHPLWVLFGVIWFGVATFVITDDRASFVFDQNAFVYAFFDFEVASLWFWMTVRSLFLWGKFLLRCCKCENTKSYSRNISFLLFSFVWPGISLLSLLTDDWAIFVFVLTLCLFINGIFCLIMRSMVKTLSDMDKLHKYMEDQHIESFSDLILKANRSQAAQVGQVGQAGQDVQLQAGQDVQLQAGQGVQLQAGQGVQLQAGHVPYASLGSIGLLDEPQKSQRV